uniref:ATCFM2 n=1 Tax=Arundo donax TaxID=35708 RepID=A0A0A9EMF8_ARUDO
MILHRENHPSFLCNRSKDTYSWFLCII